MPSISAVSPSRAFLGRKLDVTISAVGTSWSGTPVVDFGGAGVRVDRVQLASPTALVASIDVEATATPGIRDIRVSDSTSQTEYKGVFAVEPPLSVMVRGTQAQGSIVSLRVVNRDLSTPFDSSGESEGYPNLVLAPMPGVTTNLGSVSPFSLTATLLIDSDAAAGPRELKLTSGPIGDSHTFPVTTMLSVAARTPTVLSTATLTRGNVTTPYGSMLYALTAPAGLALIDTTVSNTSSAVSPQLYLLDEMGKWSEFEPLSGALLGNGARAFLLVAWDETGAPAYEFEVQTVVTPATGAVEASGNDTSAGAQVAVSLPFVLQGAGLSSATDQDWVRITVSADDVGKSLHVLTNAGPDGSETTDTLLRVFAADGTTVLATSSDYGFHDDLVTDPIEAAGTYYVVISASEVATPADDGYEAWIRME